MKCKSSSTLRGLALAFGVLAVAVAAAPSAFADEHHWRGDRGRWHEHHWRGHDWDRGGVYVGPSYGYYDYAPPPVVYPQAGLSINIPLDFH